MSKDEAKELLAKAAGLVEGVGVVGVLLVEVSTRNSVDSGTQSTNSDHTQLLGYFPLAIVQAGAYIQTNMCSIQGYLDMYQTSRGQILEDYANEVQKPDDYELTVYATWQVSYGQLSPLARQLYDYVAFMHHDQIVEDIFRFAFLGLEHKHALPPTAEETRIEQTTTEFLANFAKLADGSWNKEAFLRTTKDLTSYSLLLYDEANRSYSIHPLVQQWSRTVVVDPGAMCSRVAFLLASSVTGDNKTEDYAYRRVLLNHIDRLPDSERLRPRLAWRLHRVYGESGRAKDQERLVKAEYEVNLRVLGRDNHHTLLSMAELAQAYSSQGRWGEAEGLQREVVEVRKRVWGSEHPSTLIQMGNLAQTYSDQGRRGQAEVLQREVLEVGKRVWGSEHPDTLIEMGNLAVTYSSQGRWGAAETLQREVVEVRKRVSGNEHPETLIQMGNLAQTYWRQGRWGEAEVLQREVLEVGKRVWGSEHPETLKAMGNLALTYWEQGWRGEVEVLQREVLEVGKRVWGSEHPHTLTSMARLALTYWRQGQWGEAEVLQREVLEVGKRVRGSEHPFTLIAMEDLAATCSSQGRWKEAEVFLVEVVEVGKRVCGNQHPSLLLWTQDLDRIRSRLAQSDIPAATLPAEADNSAQLLETGIRTQSRKRRRSIKESPSQKKRHQQQFDTGH
ncbi:hypothetical protein FRC09_003359 [Ceratobasidium sp. 395]|nr:hypothetical protein FRC09_003359 [Ceratobasidium sp. 395]